MNSDQIRHFLMIIQIILSLAIDDSYERLNKESMPLIP